jgi:hypothetical protein
MNKSIFVTLLVAMFGLLHTQAWWLGGWGNRFGYGYGGYGGYGGYYGLYTPSYYGLYYPSYTYLTTPYYYVFDEDDSNAMVDDEFHEEEFSSNAFDNEEEFSHEPLDDCDENDSCEDDSLE